MKVTFSPDGRMVAMSYSEGSGGTGVIVFDLKTRGRVLEVALKGDEGPFSTPRISPDGRTVAVSRYPEGVDLWDIPTKTRIATLDDKVSLMEFSGDGKTLAVSGGDDAVRLWNVATRQAVLTLQVKWTGKPFAPAAGEVRSLAFSEDGQMLLAGDNNGGVTVWNARRPR